MVFSHLGWKTSESLGVQLLQLLQVAKQVVADFHGTKLQRCGAAADHNLLLATPGFHATNTLQSLAKPGKLIGTNCFRLPSDRTISTIEQK